jgi:hypothetical protein
VRYQLEYPPPDASGERHPVQLATIGTARLWFTGNVLTPELTYVIQLALAARDFKDGATSPIYDAYLQWRLHRDFSIRAGQFLVQFDRLRTVRENAMEFADRPIPITELSLDRDDGIMFFSDHFLSDHSILAYRLSAFGGGGPNQSIGKKPGTLLVGRLELRPFGPIDDDAEGDLKHRTRPGLALGVGGAANFNSNRQFSTTGTTFTGGTTDYYHADADLVFKWLGIAIEAEYLWRNASREQILGTNSAGMPVTQYTRSAHGWIVQASYTFDPPIAIVGRLSRLYWQGNTDPQLISTIENLGQEAGVGINYYFLGHDLKVQSDWIARMPRDFNFDRADHTVHVHLDGTF